MRRVGLALPLLALVLSLSGAAQAAPRKMLLVILDKVTWPDLIAHASVAPAFWEVAAHSAVGAMSVRTASGVENSGAYLTLGAGSRAAADPPPHHRLDPEGYAFAADEVVDGLPAATAYRGLTGSDPGSDRLFHLGVGDLEWQNLDPHYPLAIGLLGDSLRRAGLHVACLGNADSASGLHRNLVAVGMDRQGRVELGDVSDGLLVGDDLLPAGYRVSPDRLQEAFAQVAGRADLVIVDLGETSRMAECQGALPPAGADEAFVRALARADRALAMLLETAPADQWSVLVLAPSLPASYPGRSAATVAPIVWRLPGGAPGLLTSPSTRRAGFVTNTDVAASVLDYFGLTAGPSSVGRAMRVLPQRRALRTLERSLARNESVEIARRAMFRGFPSFAIAVLWLCVLAVLLGERAPRRLRVLLRGLLLLCLALPPASLLLALWPTPLGAAAIVSGAIALGGVLALAASLSARGRAADAVLALLLAALLPLDLLLGQPMLQWSTLSYSLSAGARFYGLGNELAGALLGACLMALAALLSGLSRVRACSRLLVSGLLLLLTGLVASPAVGGANFGMALSCAIGFGVFAVYLWRGRFRWVDALVLVGVAVGITVAVVAVDIAAGRGASHIGLLLSSMRAEGPAAFFDVVTRKLAMSWTLLRVSVWAGLAAAAAAVLVLALLLRPPLLLEALRRRAWLLPGLISLVVAAIAALALNDSGVLAAALALLYGAGSLAYLGLGMPGPLPLPVRVAPPEEKRAVGAD